MWSAGKMLYLWDLTRGDTVTVHGIPIHLEDVRDLAPPNAKEGVFGLKLSVEEEDDAATMLALSCEEVQRPKMKGVVVGLRYVGQVGDAAVENLDPKATYPYHLQNKHLPHPKVWQRLFDTIFSWLDDPSRRCAT